MQSSILVENYKLKLATKYLKKYGIILFKNKEVKQELKHWQPQPEAQSRFFEYLLSSHINILGYGGTRGSGKTEVGINGIIALMFDLADKFNGMYIRNTAKGLKPVFRRLKKALIREGLKERKDFFCNKVDMQIELKTGALLSFFYVDGEGLENIQGENFSHVIFEEPQYIKDMNAALSAVKAMWRSAHGITKKMIFLFNPLGASTKWLKDYFVSNGSYNITEEDGLQKVFVFASVNDNKILLKNDPSYYKMLENLPEVYRKAWLEGDFNVLSGVAFDNLTFEGNGFEDKSFRPYDYPYYISYDWGFSDASVIGFYSLITNEHGIKTLVKFKELVYKGVDAETQARNLKRELSYLDYGKNLKGAVADGQIFAKSGATGTPIADYFREVGINFVRAKKDRLSGFQHLYSAINNKRLVISKACKYFWDTVPNLVLSDKYDGDIERNPKQEDHAYDETRYMIMHLANELKIKIKGFSYE
ncbi:MAG: phage terminase large subunit [Alphaproteobacteria bacterium]|nr:phage terminase large subunit [Alphaproteobacteria bacterium]